MEPQAMLFGTGTFLPHELSPPGRTSSRLLTTHSNLSTLCCRVCMVWMRVCQSRLNVCNLPGGVQPRAMMCLRHCFPVSIPRYLCYTLHKVSPEPVCLLQITLLITLPACGWYGLQHTSVTADQQYYTIIKSTFENCTPQLNHDCNSLASSQMEHHPAMIEASSFACHGHVLCNHMP